MYAPGHVGLALLLTAPLGLYCLARRREHLAIATTLGAIGLSTVPDVDQWVPFLAHRGPTHTVWFALLVGCVVGTLALAHGTARGRVRSPLRLWAGGFALGALTIASHLAGDVLTPTGIRPFSPLSGASFTLELVYARDVAANRNLFAVGWLTTLSYWRFGALLTSGASTPQSSLRDALGDLRHYVLARRSETVPDTDDGRI